MNDEVFIQYVVKGNSDQTEGRGGYVEREIFTELAPAIEVIKSGRHGVQGCKGDGQVVQRRWVIIDGEKWQAQDIVVWGYRKDRDGKYGNGFMDLRDSEAIENPEYVEYLRLKEIYE